MSRMILALMSLTILSGCQWSNVAVNRASVVTARLETLGPNWRLVSRTNGDCCDGCVPHRPCTEGYHSCCDDLITEHTAHRCAFRGLREYRKQFGPQYSHHFKMGFMAAYEDLALNRRPSPPIVPPPLYWNAFYRSCAGQRYIDDWFAGYDAGLEMGSNSGVARFHEVYLRRNGCGGGSANRYDSGLSAQNDYGQTESFDAAQQPLQPMPSPNLNAYPNFNPYGASNLPGGVSNLPGSLNAYGVPTQ